VIKRPLDEKTLNQQPSWRAVRLTNRS